jgi:hypothetical protein
MNSTVRVAAVSYIVAMFRPKKKAAEAKKTPKVERAEAKESTPAWVKTGIFYRATLVSQV